MIWVILAFLGIPLWLIAVGILGSLWNRRQVKNTSGVFACKLRASSGDVPGIGGKFSRMSSYALWVHDVLIVYSGLPLAKSKPYPVVKAEAPLAAADTDEVKRLGEQPQLLTLRLDDDASLEVAAAQGDSKLLLGPFEQVAYAAPESARPR